MVGTSTDSVMAAPDPSGTPSMTMAKHPAAGQGLGLDHQAVGRRIVAALDPVAAHGVDRLRGEPEVAHDRDLGGDSRASIIGTRLAPPSSFTAWAPARTRAAPLRTVSAGSRW